MTRLKVAWVVTLLAGATVAPTLAADVRVGVVPGADRVTVDLGAGAIEVPGGAARERPAGESLIAWIAEGGTDGSGEAFGVQVAAMEERQAAERMAGRVAGWLAEVAVVADPERGIYRVQGGRFASRDEAALASQRLAEQGFAGAFVVPLTGAARARPEMRLALVREDTVIATAGPVHIRPRPGTTASVDGVSYRGSIELRLGTRGKLVAVNHVGLEDYLRGVVPVEMGPYRYPELEALKAQAVAARTYALANLDGAQAEGYDLCATAACQVYGGASAEVALSDRAVAETRGLVLTRQGELITAYFSATCGGHTEDVDKVFIGQPAVSSLVGVPCAPAPESSRRLPGGRLLVQGRSEDGLPLAQATAILEAHGAIPRWSAKGLAEPVSAAELTVLSGEARRLTGVPGPAAPFTSKLTLGRALVYLVGSLELGERGRVLVQPVDLQALLRSPPAERISGEEQSLASLALVGALPVFADGQLPLALPPSRGLLVNVVHRLLEGLGTRLESGAVLVGWRDGQLVVRDGGEERALPFARDVAFLRDVDGRTVPFGGGILIPGDRLRLVVRDREIDVLTLVASRSGGDDRQAANDRWSVLLERREVERRVREKHADLGVLVDLTVRARGRSGRPLVLAVVGSDRSVELRGYEIKRLLDLKDDLFVIEPSRDAAGKVSGWRFIGRGWGHGVGLCQEGAFGMALRGSGYRDILLRYYQGAELTDRGAP